MPVSNQGGNTSTTQIHKVFLTNVSCVSTVQCHGPRTGLDQVSLFLQRARYPFNPMHSGDGFGNLLFDEAKGCTLVVMDNFTKVFNAGFNSGHSAILSQTVSCTKFTELLCGGPVPTFCMVN